MKKADARGLAAHVIDEMRRNKKISVDEMVEVIRSYDPECSAHGKKLVCPTCVAKARGAKGGRNRAQNAASDSKIAAAGKLGGRPKGKNGTNVPPPTLQTPLNTY